MIEITILYLSGPSGRKKRSPACQKFPERCHAWLGLLLGESSRGFLTNRRWQHYQPWYQPQPLKWQITEAVRYLLLLPSETVATTQISCFSLDPMGSCRSLRIASFLESLLFLWKKATRLTLSFSSLRMWRKIPLPLLIPAMKVSMQMESKLMDL